MPEPTTKPKHRDRDIIIGQRLGPPFMVTPTVRYDPENFRQQADRPWIRAALARAEGIAFPSSDTAKAMPISEWAVLPARAELKHYILAGASGSGKTRLALHILRQQMEQGCSVVCLDPKLDTIEALMALARAAGIPADRVRLVMPQRGASGAPGWNLLSGGGGLPIDQAASDFVSILAELATSWGPRLADILVSTLIVIGEHGLSLFEATRFLLRDEYRVALLALEISPQNVTAYHEARDYFLNEFDRMSRSERAGAVAPVMTRLREILRSEFFQALLCPRKNTLDLFSLWQVQGAVFVHLDRTSLGDDGAKLLGGLVAHRLYRTAMRSRGPVPVVFSLDELGAQARFVGTALSEIVTVARSQGIRLLAAFQNLEQVEPGLRAALLGSTSVRVFFRLAYADARLVATSLATGAGGGLSRVKISPPLKEDAPLQTFEHPILNEQGEPLHLEESVYVRLQHLLNGSYSRPLLVLDELAILSGIERFYVRAPDTGEAVALESYLAGVPQGACRILGPNLRLEVRFCRPRVTGIERFTDADLTQQWIRAIQDLKTQHAVFNEVGADPELIRVADVALPEPGSAEAAVYMEAVLAAGNAGNDARNVSAWRSAAIERTIRGEERASRPVKRGVTSDGSID